MEVKSGSEERVEVREVGREERLVDAGLVGDLLHARAGSAAADEHPVCGVEDALLGVSVEWLSRRAGERLRLNHTVSPIG